MDGKDDEFKYHLVNREKACLPIGIRIFVCLMRLSWIIGVRIFVSLMRLSWIIGFGDLCWRWMGVLGL